jgi:hypothetical protein
MKKLLLTVAIGAGVAFAILGAALSGQASQRAQAQGPIIVGIDIDPYNTPANSCPNDGTDCTLGSLYNPDDRCRQASPGDTVEFDVYVDDLPAVVPPESILGFAYTLGGWPGTLTDPDDGGPLPYDDPNVDLLKQPGSDPYITDLSAGLPDPAAPQLVTVLDVGASEYNPPYTHGVLGRYALDLTGVAPGVYGLTLTSIALARDWPPSGDLCASYGCVAHDSTYRDAGGYYGLLAVDRDCPTAVGGIAQYPDVGESALATADSSGGSSAPPYAAIAALAAAAAVAVVAGGWYARRGWMR